MGSGSAPFDFNERAIRTLSRARDEAVRAGHDTIGPEHLLQGVIREESGVAVDVLTALGANSLQVEQAVGKYLQPGPGAFGERTLRFTPGARRALEYAVLEARAFGRRDVDSEHLLLGLLVGKENAAAKALSDCGISLETARREAIAQLRLRPEDVGPVTEPWAQPLAVRSERLGALLTSYQSHHLPPLSKTGRTVQRVLLWGTPVLVFGCQPLVLLCEHYLGLGIPSVPAVLLSLFLPVLAWLLFLAFFRLQAHILELMVILPVCSLPLGVALNMSETEESIRWLSGAIGVLMLGAGSIWGLSVAQRSGEGRTWPRLGLIALGWIALAGGVFACLALCSAMAGRPFFSSLWGHLIVVPVLAAAAAGILAEARCHRRHGPMRLW